MSAIELLKMVAARPFVPFRIEITGGATYDVRHPEMALVTLTTVAVAERSAQDIPPGLRLLATEHIVRVIPIPAPAKESA